MILTSGKPTFEMTSEEVIAIQDFLWVLQTHFRIEDGNLYRLINDFPVSAPISKLKSKDYQGEFYNIKIKENK